MTDSNKTLIVTVLDRSGSMTAIRADMEGGFNQFIAEQKVLPGECLVSLYQFDDSYDVVYENVPIAEVKPLILEPRGWTALLDALGKTITTVGEQLRALPEEKRPGAVIVQVITDGQENKSKEYSLAQVKTLIDTQQTQYNWQFLYLGASASTFGDAQSLGIAQVAQYTANSAGVKGMYDSTSASVRGYRNAVSRGVKGAKIDLGNKVS